MKFFLDFNQKLNPVAQIATVFGFYSLEKNLCHMTFDSYKDNWSRVTLGETSVYKYILEYVTTHLQEVS